MTLPVVGEIVSITSNDGQEAEVAVVAVDLEAWVWTVVERWTEQLRLMAFDENRNYTYLTPVVESWCDDEPIG